LLLKGFFIEVFLSGLCVAVTVDDQAGKQRNYDEQGDEVEKEEKIQGTVV